MLNEKLKANGGFSEFELATIRAACKFMLVAIENKVTPAEPARIKNLKKIVDILD